MTHLACHPIRRTNSINTSYYCHFTDEAIGARGGRGTPKVTQGWSPSDWVAAESSVSNLALDFIRIPLAQEASLPMALPMQSLLMVSSCGHHVLELKQVGADPGKPKGELLCHLLASLSRIL